MQDAITAEIDAGLHRIQRHPFLQQARDGLLPKEGALRWIFCAGRESRSFPSILRALIARSSEACIINALSENLADENGRGNPEDAHFQHYLRLLDEIGVSRQSFESYSEKSGIHLALAIANSVATHANDGVSVGYMLINEAITPLTYRAAQRAIERFYPRLQTRFFDLHVEVDAEHVEQLRSLLGVATTLRQDNVSYGVSLGERGMLSLLDEAYGFFH